jgi:hypothetical protein
MVTFFTVKRRIFVMINTFVLQTLEKNMKYKEAKIELFQASSFRVDDIEAFLANKDIKHIIRVMGFYRLPYRSQGDSISISLPPQAFHITVFDDDDYKVNKTCLLGAVDAIEEHIAEGDESNFTYLNVKHGEFADSFTGTIKKGETITNSSNGTQCSGYKQDSRGDINE